MAPVSFHHSSKTVCVLDASGRLGGSLVQKLLQRGYIVHAATYDHGGEMHGLTGLSCDDESLKVFRTDPFDYQSLVDAMKGCAGLLYTYEPPQDQSYDEFMVEVEVRAAHNVLEACAQTETMERVVFTSSVAAVVWKENRKLGTDLDERDWSEPNFCRKFKLWHALAKTLAEKTAWAMAMDRGVDMASVNAGLLVGPDASLASTHLNGWPEMYENGVLVTVDLNFLADAHLAVFETPSAYGRYLCFNRAVCRPEDAVKLGQMLPDPSPRPLPSDELRVIQQRIQNRKLNKVMVEFAAGTHLDG